MGTILHLVANGILLFWQLLKLLTCLRELSSIYWRIFTKIPYFSRNVGDSASKSAPSTIWNINYMWAKGLVQTELWGPLFIPDLKSTANYGCNAQFKKNVPIKCPHTQNCPHNVVKSLTHVPITGRMLTLTVIPNLLLLPSVPCHINYCTIIQYDLLNVSLYDVKTIFLHVITHII